MTEPVIDQFNLVVGDMAASVAFYRLVGFEIPDGDETWGAHHRSASVAGASISISTAPDSRRSGTPVGVAAWASSGSRSSHARPSTIATGP